LLERLNASKPLYTSPLKVKILGLALSKSKGVLKLLFLFQFRFANLSEILIKDLSSLGVLFFKDSLIILDSDKKYGTEKSLFVNSVSKSSDFAGEIIIFIKIQFLNKIIKNQILFE
jgi:hypothetical protein